ncbi:MAG: tripartite tricarboxylate transporter substrate-binding protein [Burkholderiaceae bacterium]
MVGVVVFTFKNHFKVLVLTGEQRNLATPDVPTAKELGYNNLVASSWNGLAAPVKTPKVIF